MKKLLCLGLSIVACFSLTACNEENESNLSDIEQIVEYLNADSANYLIQTISDGCCQYTGAVDGSIIKREKTHYEYKEDGSTDHTTHTTYFYDVNNTQSYTLYTSNTTNSNDANYKTTSTWTSSEKTGAVAPYLLTFDLCACCSEELKTNVFTFTATTNEDSEVNKVYSTIEIDLTKGLENAVVTVIMLDDTKYEIKNFNTVDLEIPCIEDCTE
ncbi:MAG: hypothetical protein R3Y05_06260 [bacterium]